MVTRPQAANDSSFGVLVGWSHRGFDGRLDLCLQRVSALDQKDNPAVEEHHFVMTDSQAIVLANYLQQVLDSRRPLQRKRGFFGRWLGR